MKWHNETRFLKDLKPHPSNPRSFTKKGMKDLGQSVDRFGLADPIIINTDNTILGGHARVQYLLGKGVSECDVRVPEQLLNEAQAKEIVVRLNKNVAGIFDMDILANEFELEDLLEWGFEEKELLGTFPNDVTEDEVPEPPKEPITKPGELWILGEHRVLCGDSTKREDVERLMGGGLSDLLFTDPPYGVDYASKNIFLNSISRGNCVQEDILGDKQSVSDMYKFWCSFLNVSAEYCSEKSSYYICSPQGGELMMMMMMQAIYQSPWALKHCLIWVKNNHVLGRSDYNYKHEPILYGWKKSGTHNFYAKHDVSVWEVDKPLKNDLHPTMKPIALIERALSNSSKKQDIVLDPFLGSGSTLIAAEQLGRKCYGMEIEPKYVDVIIQRWEKLTGNKAVKG